MKLVNHIKIAVVGLGYVGYPLFELLSRHFDCYGVDNNEVLINKLKTSPDISRITAGKLTSSWREVSNCTVFIVAVPTPVDNLKKPATTALIDVGKAIGTILKKGDLVVFESTIHPGATDEICIPILEQYSGLCLNVDFSAGYSPERINIGDDMHSLRHVPKIISASNDDALKQMEALYESIIDAGIIRMTSIKAAEATKMYENVQRDVLIALANEYSKFCDCEGINIYEVTECASTKWNFSKVYPGLVGGHCIGVDPYYLLERAASHDNEMPMVSLARSINEDKVTDVANKLIKMINMTDCKSKCLLLLGFSYKKNVPDIRNTKIAELINLLQMKNLDVSCFDPLVDNSLVKKEYGITLLDNQPTLFDYRKVVIAVHHDIFDNLFDLQNSNSVIQLNDLF